MNHLENMITFVSDFLITVCNNCYTQKLNVAFLKSEGGFRTIFKKNIRGPLYTSSDLIAVYLIIYFID